MAAGDHLRERDRRRALVGGRGEVGGEVGPERAAVPAEARQERRLRLADDGAGDAHHHVVEAAVLEVVLDPRAAGPGDGAVDHVELAVVGAAHLVLAPVDALAVGEEAVAVEREDVVDDDLGAGVGEAREHLARLLVGPRAEAVHDHPHLDALVELAPEERGHLHPDLALTPAEHEDVHGGLGRFDVREDPREEASPSTSGSIVAAVDQANGSAASCGRAPSRATNASVAACAPAEVTASAGGGQLGRCVIPSTCR